MEIIKLPLKYPIDIGAPTPKILASENLLLLFFFVEKQLKGMNNTLSERDAISDRGIVIMKFEDYLNFKFGSPNDEALHGHPYFNLGLLPYSFSEVKNSDWISELIRINSVHPMHEDYLFEDYRHFILTFHDSTFECIANNYKINFSTKSMGEIIADKTEDLILAS